MQSYSCFCWRIGEIKCREWNASLGIDGGCDAGGGGGGDAADTFVDGVGDIRLSKKNPKGFR